MLQYDKFVIKVDKKNILNIISKVKNYKWDKLPDINNWFFGANKEVLREICHYWVNSYNWEKEQKKLNEFNHYKAQVEDLNIHFIYEKGNSSNTIPLLISHGWPGSIVEFKEIIGPLTDPYKYGIESDFCFDVIIPSIPGFAFSSAPTLPYGPRKISNYYNKLMTKFLNYDQYFAQGGDWGGAIASWLGLDHNKFCKGIHINIMIMRDKKGVQTKKEKSWQTQFKKNQILEEGYRTLQSTKPQTLAIAMIDNPVGVASWILEKFYGWSDIKNNNLLETFNIDDLITNIMIYLVTNSFGTASWIYYGRRQEGGRVMNANGKRVEVPTACALFPKEFLAWPPKSYVKRLYNVMQWSKMPAGGHFASMEEPDLLTKDIYKYFKLLKKSNII